jgi:hypothetical protein
MEDGRWQIDALMRPIDARSYFLSFTGQFGQAR